MYVIAGAAVLLVVIILVVASMSKKSEEDSGVEKRQIKEKIAEEAYKNCKAYQVGAPHEYVGLLNLIADAKAQVAGTDWEVRLTALQKEAEATKLAKEKRDQTAAKVDELRARIGQEPKAANGIKEQLEVLRGELTDDKELQERISQAIEEAQRAAFQCEFDEVNQYVQTNPTDYEAQIDKYNKLRQDVEAFPEDYQQQMLPQIDERIRWVKDARDNDATSRWGTIRGNAEASRQKRDYFSAKSEVTNFIENDRYAMCGVMEEARRYLRELEEDEKAWNEEQRREREKPPDPGPGPGPGPGPAAGAIALFDGVNLPGMRRGSTASWEVADGELRARHNTATPAGGDINVSDLIEFHLHPSEKCVFEFDAKVFKVGFGFFLGLRAQGTESKWTTGVCVNNPSLITPEAWHHYRVEYDGARSTLTVDGGRAENLDLRDAGRGACALGVYPGCEVHFKNISLLQK